MEDNFLTITFLDKETIITSQRVDHPVETPSPLKEFLDCLREKFHIEPVSQMFEGTNSVRISLKLISKELFESIDDELDRDQLEEDYQAALLRGDFETVKEIEEFKRSNDLYEKDEEQ